MMLALAFSSPLILSAIGVSVTLLLVSMLWWWRRQRQRRLLYAGASLEDMLTAELSSRPDDEAPFPSSGSRQSSALADEQEHPDSKVASTDEAAGRLLARTLRKRHSGVWRPPSRESLMRRQQEEDRRRANPEQPSQRFIEARPSMDSQWPSTRDSQEVSGGAKPPKPEPDAARRQTAVVSDIERSNPLLRKRQGLDSLITELPQNAEESNGES